MKNSEKEYCIEGRTIEKGGKREKEREEERGGECVINGQELESFCRGEYSNGRNICTSVLMHLKT